MENDVSSTKRKVLIADDCVENFRIYDFYLKKENVDMEFVEDGVDVLSCTSEGEYDLIFMDIEMPKMSGIEALQKIRKKGVDCPVVALSAYEERSEDHTSELSS